MRYNNDIYLRHSRIFQGDANMKRIFALVLALLLVCSLAACSKDKNDEDDNVDLTVTSDGNYYNVNNSYKDRFAFEVINGNEFGEVRCRHSNYC